MRVRGRVSDQDYFDLQGIARAGPDHLADYDGYTDHRHDGLVFQLWIPGPAACPGHS